MNNNCRIYTCNVHYNNKGNSMKKLNIFILCLFSSFLMMTSFAKSADNILKVEKFKTSAQSYMDKSRIETSIKKIEGVDDVDLSLESKILTVNYDDKKLNSDKIIKIVEDMLISCETIKPVDNGGRMAPKHENSSK